MAKECILNRDLRAPFFQDHEDPSRWVFGVCTKGGGELYEFDSPDIGASEQYSQRVDVIANASTGKPLCVKIVTECRSLHLDVWEKNIPFRKSRKSGCRVEPVGMSLVDAIPFKCPMR